MTTSEILSFTEKPIKCIANTEEEYISLSKHILIDTYTDKDGNERENKRVKIHR